MGLCASKYDVAGHGKSYGTVVVGVPIGSPCGGLPSKFVVDDAGVRRLNPAYIHAKQGDKVPATTAPDPYKTLPTVSTHEELHKHLPQAIPAESYVTAAAILSDPEVAATIGPDGVGELERILHRHETPMGLTNKLLALADLHAIEFIVDDSYSMGTKTDPKATGYETRWAEAEGRLLEMIEVLAAIPCPPISITFLNSVRTVVLSRASGRAMPAAKLFRKWRCTVQQLFKDVGPKGSTPAAEAIEASLAKYGSSSVGRYFFGDGEPNGGYADQQRIVRMLASRPNPAQNPFTFISCTDDDRATTWMKEAEEVVPYCAEYDDFASEAAEVHADQGGMFPFTRGLYLISTLVGALCPEDLDALDESIPLPKRTLSNIVGYELAEAEYARYFGEFQQAQHVRHRVTRFGSGSEVERVKARMDWASHYETFRTAPSMSQIPQVRAFRAELASVRDGRSLPIREGDGSVAAGSAHGLLAGPRPRAATAYATASSHDLVATPRARAATAYAAVHHYDCL